MATDENHYSKRAILSGVLASTLGVRFTRGEAAAEAHLDRAIDQVMAFEKWKAKLPSPLEAARGVAGRLAALRYGAPRGRDFAARRISGPEAGSAG